jgi:hypothetical protein
MTLAESARVLRHDGARLDTRFPLGAADARRLLRANARRRGDEPAQAIARDIRAGVLPVMNLGGGDMDFLVVTGEERGQVWQAWERGWSPVRRGGFFEWFEETF